MNSLSIAIIGCGAVAERGHIPAIINNPNANISVLVDKNLPRAQEIASKFDISNIEDDFSKIMDDVDAAIIALPHFLHAPVSIEFLKNGIHVLIEKPMALNTAECDKMIRAADEGDAILMVGLMRRFLPSHIFIKYAMDKELIGKIKSFDIQEGNVYNWPVASDFFFKKDKAGGGVLMDTGAHTIDSMLWWLGEVKKFQYFDDNFGGVEADCHIDLTMESGANGIVELSRTRNLRNTAIIEGEKGIIEVHLRQNMASIYLKEDDIGLSGNCYSNTTSSLSQYQFTDLFRYQLDNWISAIKREQKPIVTPEEARSSISFIESCYLNRKNIELPWLK